ncbi:ATP-binding protein [Tannerella forsythia]|uniref:hybrid sensor histidine kinase/response regulator transcription factor n=1 Tax=Tannerella forsythia TaxID=28112 RepID=UPI0028F1074C|nr:ATP-binding protein [Tannerella forsythia]
MQYDKYNLKTTLQPHHEPFNSYGGGGCRLILSALAAFISVCLLLVSCGKKSVSFTPDERKMADSIVRSAHDIDSLALLQKRMESEGDRLGSIIALREWGKALRNESRFEEALNVHSKGQQQAEAVGDTLEWVQALNNIGTDYRRMGVLDVAQEYHYRAWTLSEECADTSSTTRKNRAISLNGLGNIYMTLGNYERADSALRMALEGERQLHSALGQAINYANLGSIFEHRGQTDSAWVYYLKSMALNTEAGSTLGISLCHTYFGSLYEKARQYGKATEEYETAYRLMQESKDEWHALNSLVALAGIYHTTGNDAKEMEYLGKAKAIAERIKSPEHLAEIHTLYYKHYKRTGDYRTALSAYEQATVLQDSVLNMEKVNRIQNTSLNIERNRQAREMGEARHRLEQERTARYVGFGVLGIVLLVLSGVLTIVLYTNRLHRRNHLALKRLSALRENFFTNITHEFRTPLTVILGLSHNLQDADTEAVRENARTIERQGKGLLTLINQLLDISKIKSSVGNPDWYNGNITAHLTMIIEAYRDYARSRNIDLHFLAREAVEMDFVPDYVSKVMNNLLSNAFKFTPEYGKVSVLVWREGNCLFLDVSDTGEGIDKETVSHVFEPFYQAETEARSIGTGVGLALVKQIIDAVEGSITVESTVGKGTTFHIHVPIHHDSKRKMDSTMIDSAPLLPENETTLADSENDDNQCRLLVIEDNHDIAAYIGSLFADRYAVSYAANGKERMEKALDLVPDLIITDLMMPGMDGLEVCRQVRGNEIINHIPIIVVTAKITEEERIKGLEAGADAYISKPFNADELRTRVEKLLDRHHRLRDKFSNIADTDKEQKLTDVERRFLAKAVDFIYHLLDKRHLDVNTLAEKLYMSPRQLHRKLVAITGDSPATYMLKIKMQKARNLLETKPGLTIEDIAEHCGFEHTPNFYSAFKKTYGVTPMDYRRGIGF